VAVPRHAAARTEHGKRIATPHAGTEQSRAD
jgi:hypothetical protein